MYLYVRIRVGLVESWHMYTTLHMVTDANFTWIDGGEGVKVPSELLENSEQMSKNGRK